MYPLFLTRPLLDIIYSSTGSTGSLLALTEEGSGNLSNHFVALLKIAEVWSVLLKGCSESMSGGTQAKLKLLLKEAVGGRDTTPNYSQS